MKLLSRSKMSDPSSINIPIAGVPQRWQRILSNIPQGEASIHILPSINDTPNCQPQLKKCVEKTGHTMAQVLKKSGGFSRVSYGPELGQSNRHADYIFQLYVRNISPKGELSDWGFEVYDEEGGIVLSECNQNGQVWKQIASQ